MKFFFVIFLYLFQSIWNNLSGQDLVLIQDTINNFAVGVPVGWKYGVPMDKSVTFVAYREKLDAQDIPRENFNINIFHGKEMDIDKSFNSFLEIIGAINGFKLLMKGEKIINGRKFKFLLETHKNQISNEDMTNSTYFTNDSGKILVLTMVTTSPNFDKYKELFETVALSLIF